MKQKKLLYGILTVILTVFAFVAPFLDMFALNTNAGSGSTTSNAVKLFGDTEAYKLAYALTGKEFNNAWLVVVYVLILVLLALSILYIVMFVLELVKVKGSWVGLVKKIASIGLLVGAILTVVFTILAMVMNFGEVALLESTVGVVPQVGVYLSFISLLAGITGLLSCAKTKTRKR